MEFIGVTVPDEVVDTILAQPEYVGKAGAKTSKAALVKDYVEKLLTGAVVPPATVEPHMPTVAEACDVILSQLDEEHQRLLKQLALETERPVAAYILSPIMLARDNGTFGVLLGEWMDSTPQQAQVTKRPSALTCEQCHKPIDSPKRHDQRFCNEPEDGNSCGRAWNIAQIQAKREPKRVAAEYGPQHFVGSGV